MFVTCYDKVVLQVNQSFCYVPDSLGNDSITHKYKKDIILSGGCYGCVTSITPTRQVDIRYAYTVTGTHQ